MPRRRVDNNINTINRLEQRIACNGASSESFADFVLGVLDPRDDDTALDIGPGLGAQLLPVSERVRQVVGLDVSVEMVAELRARIHREQATVVNGNMDDLGKIDLGGPFSLVYAVYSLHYSRDPAAVVQRVADCLERGSARFVCVSPDLGNNEAWFADLRQLYELPENFVGVSQITRNEILPAFLDAFQATTCISYVGRVRFPTLEALMSYYDACAPYCRTDKRSEAERLFAAKIRRDGSYEITKHSLALVGTSPNDGRR